MKQLGAAVLTGLLLFVVLRANVAPPLGSDTNAVVAGIVDPVAVVERSFLTAAQGDIDGYLALFAGDLRTTIEREMNLQGSENYRATLTQHAAGLKGRVIEPVKLTPDASEIEVRVERVYAFHNERQTYRLRREQQRWQIVGCGPIERFQPSIPYGTPVYGGQK